MLSRRQLLKLGVAGGLTGLARRPGSAYPSQPGEPNPPPLLDQLAANSLPARKAGTSSSRPGHPAWSGLAESLRGRLELPSSPAYSQGIRLYNAEFDDIHPAAVAYCAGAEDVARCIEFARHHDIDVAARSGGHSYAGYSTTKGLVIDVSLMSGVSRAGRSAVVGAGAQLIDLYSALAATGASVPGGSCPTVGVAGLCLGGGIGVMDRLHGLTCDHLESLELVTAAGEVTRADASTNPELFWACRGGGGGNFGVVTEMTLSTFPIADLCLFELTWPWGAAASLLAAWFDWISGAPDELWSDCILTVRPAAPTPLAQVAGVWVGNASGARSLIDGLVAKVGPTSGEFLVQDSFINAMFIEAGCDGLSRAACHVQGDGPGAALPRQVTVAKSDVFNRSPTGPGIDALLAGIRERQSQRATGQVIFDSWGGAINRVGPAATAFVHRRAVASAQYLARLPASATAADVGKARKWLNEWYASLRPYASGEAYQNYIDPDLDDWQHAYYGANLGRLEKVKSKWDPDDFFHFSQSIPPARFGAPHS